MDELFTDETVLLRPSRDAIRSAWSEIFSDPLVSTSRLKAAALSKAGLGHVDEDGGIILRSVYWRIYQGLLPAPTSLDQYPDALITSRQAYARLRRRYLLAPDGRWASDCSPPIPEDEGAVDTPGAGPSRSASPSMAGSGGGKSWDPLSLESESPWKTWFAHLELRQTIRQDVDRTFPDIDYFKLERVRRCMVSILFLYSVTNQDVGYRQGMHELLAVCFWAVDRDATSRPASDAVGSPLARDVSEEAMYATLDERYTEHDAYGLFVHIMKSAKSSYEWRAEEAPRSKTTAQAQAPIITRCQHIHHGLVGRIDPQLWERLENEGVEAQIWAIRWIRLIFTRELPFSLALRLWDGIFADEPSLRLVDFVCVAMLLLIRNELIEADYPTLLTNLLHYPAPSATYPFDPSLILSQAIFLRDNITPASGVQVVIQNQELLGIKAQPPERPVDPDPRGHRTRAGRPAARGGVPINHAQQQPRPGVQGFAQGWLDRAQAAGLDKAVLSAVSDLRRNLPESASAYLPNLPFSPLSPSTRDGSFSSIPTSASALPNRGGYFPRNVPSPSFAPTSSTTSITTAAADQTNLQERLKEQERQLGELRLIMIGMGKAMSSHLSALPTASGTNTDEQDEHHKGLERIRDALLDSGACDVDTLMRQWVWQETLDTSAVQDSGQAPARPPPSSVPEDITPAPPFTSVSAPVSAASPSPTAGPGSGPGTPSTSFPSSTLSQPPLRLSSRVSNGPMTSLPRVPQTAPLGSTHGRAYSPTHPRETAAINSNAFGATKQAADPLAGLGVQSVATSNPGRKESPRGDPLGVGPL